MDVDAALASVPINKLPLIDDTDFVSIEDAVVYNQAGLALFWNFTTTAGVTTVTAVTPTTAGNYDWTDFTTSGMYGIEIPASGGASANNDTEGFGHFTGVATGILPWAGPVVGFRAAGINNVLVDLAYSATRGLAGTALPDAVADAAGGLPISDLGGLALDDIPITAEFEARTLVAASYFDPAVDAVATVTTLTNLPSIPTNWLTAAGIAASALNGKGDWNVGKTGYALTTADWNVGKTGYSLTVAPLTAVQVNAEVDTALADIGLDHLISSALPTNWATDVASGSVFDNVADDGTAVFNRTTDSLQAIADSGGGGPTAVQIRQEMDSNSTQFAAIIVDTGTDIPARFDGVEGATFATGTDSLEAIRDRGDAAWTTGAGGTNPLVLQNTTIATLATQVSFTLTAGSADDDAYNGLLVIVEDQTTATQKCIGVISDYIGTTKTVTLREDPGVFVMATGDTIDVVAVSPDILNILADTNELQADDVPGLIAALNNISTANLDTALATYDGPTNAEMVARTLVAASYFDPAVDAVANVTLVATTTTNTDMLTAAAVNTEVDTALTDIHLDHLMATAAADVVVDGSVIAHMVSTTEDWSTFIPSTDALQAIRDRGDAAWITGAGTGLTALASGTAQSGTATTIVLAVGESFANDELNGNSVKITAGTGAGQSRVIIDYVGATDTATISPAWITNPSSDSVYEVVDGSVNVNVWLGAAVTTALETASDIVDEWETQSQADPTGFHVNVKEVNGTIQTANDNGADINAILLDTDAIVLDTAEIGTAGAGLTNLGGMSTAMRTEVESEANDALVALRLDHLVAVADADDPVNNSIMAKLASTTGDWSLFAEGTDALQAIRDRGDAAWVTGAGGSDPFVLVNTTIATLATQVSFTLTAGSVDDDAYNGMLVVVEDQTTATQKCIGVVSDYTGSTKTVTLREDPGVFTMATGDTIDVLTISPDILNVLADTNELQVDNVPGLIAALNDFNATTDAVANVTLVATTTTNTDMVGTDSAATAAALATAQTDLDTITGSDGVTLATAQGLYAPAKAGDSMDMLSISGSTVAADNLEESTEAIITGSAVTGTLSTTAATTSLTGYADDELINRLIIFKSGTANGQAATITDYANASGLVTFSGGITTAPANGDLFVIT